MSDEKEPEEEDSSGVKYNSDKRKRMVKDLDGMIYDLINRWGEEQKNIKSREIPYNINMLVATREKLIERTPPAPQEQATLTVNGLSREQAIELLRGHRAPPGT